MMVAIANAQREPDKPMAVLFVDLDGFKTVNDNYGHDAGDAVLKQVANRMTATVRKSDTVARIGGDELLVIVTGIHGALDAELVAGKLIERINQPCDYRGQQLRVGASIGIAVYPQHGSDVETLLKSADAAMYAVKRAGKNRYQLAAQAAGHDRAH